MDSKEFFSTLNAADQTPEEKQDLILGYLKKEGEAAGDYAAFKTTMDGTYNAMAEYGIEQLLYGYLCDIMDWRSRFTDNALKYIAEKVKPQLSHATTDKALYNAYVKDKTENVFPFEERPTLSGDRAVIVNVKTQECKDFWRGYFAYAKKALQEEKAAYDQIVSDTRHPLHGAYTAAKKIEKSSTQMMFENRLTARDCVEQKHRAGCLDLDVEGIGNSYASRIKNFDLLYNTTDMIITAKLGGMAKSLIGKFKK